MANVKISQLPAASTVTADVDVLPIVHSGVTEKVTPNQIVNKVLEAPGAIGGTTPDDATFTTLTAESSVFLNPANADVELSPTGSGRTLILPEAGAIINPGVLSYMDNVAIGGTTPQAAVFTTLTSNSTTTLNGTTIPASKTLVDTDSVQTLSSKYYLNPRIWDWDQNNYYRISPLSPGLATDVYCYLPILTGNDYFSFRNFAETLTNKTISGLSNTLTDIPNSSFQYSSITLGSTSISLGGTASSISGLALTGGTVNNTAIGGTTASSGAFTTLSSTGNTTLGDAAGDTLTINGTAVACPNNLNFDSNTLFIDAANNAVGIGTSSPVLGKLNVTTGYAATDTTARPIAFFSSSDTASAGNAPSGFYAQFTGNADKSLRVVDLMAATFGSGTYGTLRLNNSISILSSGNVGIGTSSPGTKIDVNGAATTNNTSRYVARLGDTSSVAIGNGGGIMFQGVYTGTTLVDGCGIQAYKDNATSGDYAYSMTFATRANGGNLTERMRIDSSGNLGLGVTPSQKFQVGGTSAQILGFFQNTDASNIAYITVRDKDGLYANIGRSSSGSSFIASSDSLRFLLGSTQAMTLDASGNLLVGQTSAGLDNSNSHTLSKQYGVLYTNHVSGTASGGQYAIFGYNAAQIGSITQNGTTGVLYNTSSDQRLKTNITPAGSAVQSILDFPVDQFDWISSGEHQDFGAVAQKAINVIPEMVSVPSDPDEIWGIDWSKAVPRLIRAYQELHAEIKLLKAKVN